jgi:hypothetical protein
MLMSRRVEERDILVVDGYHGSTDVLRDTACLAVRHTGGTDGIQQGSLTMVNVTHDADNRRSGNHRGLVLFFLFEEFLDHVYFFFKLCNDIVLQCDLLCFLKVDLMVYGNHHAFHEKFLNDHRRLDLHLLCQLTDRHFLRKCDLLDLRLLFFLLRLYCRFLKSLWKSGFYTATALVRTASAAAGLIKFFLLVLVLSVTLSLAVLGCLGQLWRKYRFVIISAGSLAVAAIAVLAACKTIVAVVAV